MTDANTREPRSSEKTPAQTFVPGLSQRLVAEFIGTLFLLAAVIGSAQMGQLTFQGNDGMVLLANALATGAALAVLILVFGPISGAHFNPAVSLAFMLRKELSRKDFPLYVAVQLAGGIVGVLIAHVMFDLDLWQVGSKNRSGPGQWVGEVVATFALLASILALLRNNPKAIPYAVGLIITAGYWYTSSTSFANPAVTFARMFTDTPPGIRPVDAPAFILIQCLTAAGAVYLFGWLTGDRGRNRK